jgi:head-tail adaptor
MDAGRLNKPVTILSPSTVTNAYNEPSTQWATVTTTMAAIEDMDVSQLFQTGQFVDKVTTKITMRWRSGVILSGGNRIQYVDPTAGITHTYEVKAVTNPKKQNVWFIAFCYELDGRE